MQELVVYHQLTISESIRYMGGILGLTDESILSKTNFLVDLLRLPSKTMVIRNLR